MLHPPENGMNDYYCPNCYADLELQYGFDPEKGYLMQPA